MEYRTLQDALDELSENDGGSYTAYANAVADTLIVPSNVELTIVGTLSTDSITNNGTLIIDGDANAESSITITNSTDTASVTATVASNNGLVAMMNLNGVDTIVLLNDISATSALNLTDSGNKTINLNNHTLTTSGTATNRIEISGSSTVLTIKDGVLADGATSRDTENALIKIMDGSSIVLDSVTGSSYGGFLWVYGTNTKATLSSCTINVTGSYGVATNADKSYNGYDVTIDIESTTINAPTPVYINVPGTLKINSSYLYGEYFGLLVRAGSATVSDSTISTSLSSDSGDWTKYDSTNWGNGSNVAPAAVTIGNKNGSYSGDATLSLTNVSLLYNKGTNSRAIYAIGGVYYNKGTSDTANKAIITYDGNCTANSEAITESNIVVGGNSEYVSINEE